MIDSQSIAQLCREGRSWEGRRRRGTATGVLRMSTFFCVKEKCSDLFQSGQKHFRIDSKKRDKLETDVATFTYRASFKRLDKCFLLYNYKCIFLIPKVLTNKPINAHTRTIIFTHIKRHKT